MTVESCFSNPFLLFQLRSENAAANISAYQPLPSEFEKC